MFISWSETRRSSSRCREVPEASHVFGVKSIKRQNYVGTRYHIWQPCLTDLECLEVVERPEVGEDCGLLGVRVVEAVEAISPSCNADVCQNQGWHGQPNGGQDWLKTGQKQ